MTKRLSGWSVGELSELLVQLREIVGRDDASAMDELDKVIVQIQLKADDDYDPDDDTDFVGGFMSEEDFARDAMDSLRQKMENARRAMAKGEKLSPYDGRSLVSITESYGSGYAPEVRAKLGMDALVAEARDVGEAYQEAQYEQMLAAILTERIGNVSSISRLHRNITDAVTFFEASGRTSEAKQAKVRAALEHLAWYRAKKKLADAEVALASGNASKGQKLTNEAEVMLRQDWAFFFADETPPPVT